MTAKGFPPYWWNEHGQKMNTEAQEKNALVIRNKVAKLEISYVGHMNYRLAWQILFDNTQYGQQMASGQIFIGRENLAAAFDLAHTGCPTYFQSFYEAKAGAIGKFIRTDSFLNIPGPGTGQDGDPNISIFVSEDIKRTVAAFLNKQ